MKSLLALVFTSVSLHAATSTDWPRFLGPTGAATVAESKAPLKWSVTLLLVATLAVAVDWIFCLFDAAGWLPKFRLLFEAWWPNKKNTD